MANSAWKIGNVTIDNPVVVAPMAGISNPAFRTICKAFQPGLIYAEMVSDKAIYYKNEKTLEMTKVEANEHPITMQLFGNTIDTMVHGAKFLDQHCACDIIDVNMGCPVNKVIKANAGSYLMLHEDETVEMMKAVVEAVHKPVTAKMRIGFDMQHINCVSLSKKLEQVGVQAIVVHGRTRSQMYEGKANWDYIKQVKEAVSIPVIGNGDITSPELAKQMLDETKCDAVMIGRGVLGDPWLISRCVQYLTTGKYQKEPTLQEKFDMARMHAKRLCAYKGESVGMKEMRGHSTWYVKGLYQSHILKDRLAKVSTYQEMEQALFEYESLYGDDVFPRK